jgi:hypothetical protein
MNQRTKMIHEINSFVDGGSMANAMMMGMQMNPVVNQISNQNINQAPIMIFNPIISEDYKYTTIMEINNRLLEW